MSGWPRRGADERVRDNGPVNPAEIAAELARLDLPSMPAPLPGRYTIGVGGHADEDDAYAEWLAAQPGVTVGRREGEGDAYYGNLQATATRRAWAAYTAA